MKTPKLQGQLQWFLWQIIQGTKFDAFDKVKTNQEMMLKDLSAVWDKAIDQSVTVTE